MKRQGLLAAKLKKGIKQRDVELYITNRQIDSKFNDCNPYKFSSNLKN